MFFCADQIRIRFNSALIEAEVLVWGEVGGRFGTAAVLRDEGLYRLIGYRQR